MFNALLCAAEYVNFFNFDSLLGTTVCVGLILMGAAILANLIVFFAARSKFKLSVLVSVLLVLLYLIVVIILNIRDTAKDGGFESGSTGMSEEDENGIVIFNTSNAVWISVAVIVVFGALIALLLIDRKKVSPRAHTLAVVYAALSVALGTGLSYLKMFDAPYGGSITLFGLLPIALYSYMFGVRRGTLAGFIYGLLQLLQGPNILHPAQFFLDYIIPFAVVGACGGVFRPLTERSKLSPVLKGVVGLSSGIVLGILLRYLFHVISGAVFFGEYAGEYGFDNAWAYSAAYNALYVFPDGAICLFGGLLLMLSSSFRGQTDRVTAAFRKSAAKPAFAAQTAGAEAPAQENAPAAQAQDNAQPAQEAQENAAAEDRDRNAR